MERTAALRAGILAGFVGGILIDAYLFTIAVASGTPLGTAMSSTYAFIASVAFGAAALKNAAAAVPIGIVFHFCVAIGWALGYAYLALAQPHLLRRPWLSGLGFGLVVYVCMNVVLLYAGVYHRPASPAAFSAAIVAHLVFYGLPVALVVGRMLAPSTRPA